MTPEEKSQFLKSLDKVVRETGCQGKQYRSEPVYTDISGSVKLINAISMGSDDHVRDILNSGAEANTRTMNGFMPWQLALMFGRKELAKELYEAIEATPDEPEKTAKSSRKKNSKTRK